MLYALIIILAALLALQTFRAYIWRWWCLREARKCGRARQMLDEQVAENYRLRLGVAVDDSDSVLDEEIIL